MSGLYNVDKLKESIKNSTDSKIGLIQIFVKSLNEINNTYGFEKGNEVFKIICAEIRNIAKNQIGTYKLEGQKIAIMLANKNESQEIIEKIKDLVIKYQNDYIKVESYISYTEDRKEKILFSSSKSMDEAFMREINRKN